MRQAVVRRRRVLRRTFVLRLRLNVLLDDRDRRRRGASWGARKSHRHLRSVPFSADDVDGATVEPNNRGHVRETEA